MKQTAPQSVLIFSAVLMAALALVTLLAIVIVPPCTGIMQKADTYKIASLCFFLGAYYLLAWRSRSVIAAVLLPASQILSGLLFASYLNSLPLGCPE
jgi:Na+/melibiose symporter-like transporter